MRLDFIRNLPGVLELFIAKRVQVERNRLVGLVRLEDENEPVLFVILQGWPSSSSRPVLPDARLIDKQMHRRQRKDFAVRCLKQPPHILAPHLESPTRDAGDDIVSMAGLVPERPQTLNPRNFVASRTVVLRKLRLDKRDRIELVGDDEIWRLVKSRDAFRPFRLPETYFPVRQNILDGRFDHLPHELAHRVPVRSERPPEKALVEKNGIRDAEIGNRL
jgi:hypothetical protein